MTKSPIGAATTRRDLCAQPHYGAPGSEGGFVLVGVVMFVLALTILGLSLFSLSGYEAQFMTASYRRTQLFYDAMSAIDRTKSVLASSGVLDAASTGLPLPGFPSIVMAQASQNGESTGVVKWSDPSKHITIRVRAEQPGRPSDNITLEAAFVPQSDKSLYRDLISTPGHIHVHQDASNFEHGNIFGYGRIRNPDELDWSGKILGITEYADRGFVLPNVQDFFDQWLPSSAGEPGVTGGAGTARIYDFDPGSTYKIYDGPKVSISGFDLYEATADSIILQVGGSGGTAVWLLPGGACFERWVTVSGSSSSNLIIVASKSASDTTYSARTGANPGLWFQGGIHSTGPNLFLVSDGTVALDRRAGISHDYSIPFLTVFSGGVMLRGPKGGNDPATGEYFRKFQLYHDTNDDAILDPLYDDNLLPNVRGRDKTFTLVPGSFSETADSNPY